MLVGVPVWVWALVVQAACQSTPVPELDRAVVELEQSYRDACEIADPVEGARALLGVQRRTRRFLASLAGETEMVPHADVRASSAYKAGRGMFTLERFDIDGPRRRGEALLRRVDRYLTTVGAHRLEGTGYRLEDGELVAG